ncbi:MAG TPA: DUF2182 domain-containing protein [Candidatus Dormibacteraeota bacterium]|nr:DUF2182 domain-containing protein [Candidatus Dormibacteraeota bacterium]
MTSTAASMAAMMLVTAVPFLVALRRPGQIAVAGAIYIATWALIGAGASFAMGSVMLPSHAAAGAVLVAGIYLLTPWARHARARCQLLCRQASADPVRAGLSYTCNCLLCSAGVMAALMVLGMTNLAVLAAATAVLLLYKVPFSVA